MAQVVKESGGRVPPRPVRRLAMSKMVVSPPVAGSDSAPDLLHEQPQPVARELDALPADADEQTRQSLAERLVPYVRSLRVKHPGLHDLASDAPRGRRHADRTIGKAIADLYNPAQVDVMRRLQKLLSDS
ncbi:hypothetical protein [Streptomyces sp. NPDC023327]|uniref:hypothetical protein n=1 Tax=Streptomyces sp. NPDC023327 TaxID=3157088 RepID=UPI00340D9FE3